MYFYETAKLDRKKLKDYLSDVEREKIAKVTIRAGEPYRNRQQQQVVSTGEDGPAIYAYVDWLNADGSKDIVISTPADVIELPEDCSFLFYDLRNMEEFVIENKERFSILEGRTTKNTSHMFENCREMRELDLSSVFFSNVIDASYMCSKCNNLEKVHLGNLYEEVRDIRCVLEYCGKLKKADLSDLLVNGVPDGETAYPIYKCSQLEEVNMGTVTFNDIKYGIFEPFDGCNHLKRIKVLDQTFYVKDIEKLNAAFRSEGGRLEDALSGVNPNLMDRIEDASQKTEQQKENRNSEEKTRTNEEVK